MKSQFHREHKKTKDVPPKGRVQKDKVEVSDDPIESLRSLVLKSGSQPIPVHIEPSLFGREEEVDMTPLYIHPADLMEIYNGTTELNISVIQLWCM